MVEARPNNQQRKKELLVTSDLTFFHLAPIPLSIGSQILPGNWGRIKRMEKNGSDKLFREYVIERVRERSFPSKPSRMNCVFAFVDIQEAVRFRAANGAFEYSLIYRIAADVDRSSIHYANYNFPAVGNSALEYFEELARTYWSEEPKECVEVLIPAPVTILERMSE